MAFSLHNHCPCCVLCRVHTRLTPTADTSTASLFLSCLTFCWSASSFDKQVDSVKEHLTCVRHRLTYTLSLFVCGLVTSKMLLWLRLKLPPFNKAATSLVKTQLYKDLRKRLWTFFFSFESATASCVSSGDLNLAAATFSDVCWSGPVSAGTQSFVLDPTTVTPALSSFSAHFDCHMINEILIPRQRQLRQDKKKKTHDFHRRRLREVKSTSTCWTRSPERKNKHGTEALRTFAWINCA